ncbi:MAG: radical SAM protein [Clostridia bacterium]|nr:radical SAM protein [Clostridia bacterium]
MICNLCPNNCNIDRSNHVGRCKANDYELRIAHIGKFMYEEPVISGTKGSGSIFFSGCSLDCNFCQNYEISKKICGQIYTPKELSDEFKALEELGVHNINLVTPTHYSHLIMQALDIYRPNIPICYNTSGYEHTEIIKELCNYVDIFLTDFKYVDNDLGYELSKIKNYYDYASLSLDEMIKHKKIIIDENQIMQQGVIVRHLVLPTHIDNSIKFLEMFSEKYKNDCLLSLMSQFTPLYKSSINRTLNRIEYKLLLNKLEELEIDNGFIQELDSSGEKYIPKFNKI